MKKIEVNPGDVYGRLTIVDERPRRICSGKPVRRFACKCDCGNLVTVHLHSLRNGSTTSCGCYQREVVTITGHNNTTHRQTGTPTYRSWHCMKHRCSNPNHKHYPRYGGRGISVCKRWMDSFEAFYSDMGPRPAGCSIDRINNDGDYEKSNCRWATWKQQNRNRKDNVTLTFDGETLCAAEWAERVGLNYTTLWSRLKTGWSVKDALTTPSGLSKS